LRASHTCLVLFFRFVDAGGLTGRDLIPLGEFNSSFNAFDSHLCYASPPVHAPGEGERLYYMGSNGKHSGSQPHRNASLGMALLRTDGFAGLSGRGHLTTAPLLVAHEHLTVTLDILRAGGFVRVGVVDPKNSGAFLPGLSPADCRNLTASATDGVVAFASGASLRGLMGQSVAVTMLLHDATVYTLGM